MEPDVGLGVDSGDGMGTTVRANTGGTTGWDETEARVNGNRNPGTPGDDRARSSLRKEKGGEDDGEEEGEEEKEKNQTQWQPSPPPQGPHPPSAVAPDPPASAFALTAASTVPITLSSSPGFALASPQEALKNPATTPPANPREHELNQVRRRFRGVREWREPVAAFSTPPLRGEDHGGGGVCSQDGHDRYDGSGNKATVLSFRLQPSDPDVRTDGEVKRLLGGGRGGGSGGHGQGRGGFGLECVLRVPAGYRGIACGGGDNDGSTTNIKTDADVLPSLQITNAALDRAARQALEDRFLAAVAPISIPAAGPRAREAGGNGRANLRANSNTLLRALNLLDHGLRDVLLTGTGAGAGAGASAGGDEHQPLLLSSQQRPKEAGQRQRRSKQQPTKKQQQQQQQKQRQRNQTEGNARTGAPRNPRRQTSGEGAVRGTPLTTPPFTVNAPDTAHTTMQHTEKPLPLASGPSHPSSPDPRRRQREITQLKARFRLNPLFSASADDTALTVPVTVSPLPSGSPATSLRTVRRVHLLVPPVYPGEPCGVCFDADPAGGGNGGEDRGLEEAAAWTEAGFAAHAEANRAMSLLAQVNFLAARMHGLAVAGRQMKEKEEADKARSGGAGTGEMPDRNVNTATQVSDQRTYAENGASAEAGVQYTDADADADAWAAETGKDGSKDTVADRPHLHIIPRPPEWTVGQDDDSSTDYTNSEASSAELDEDASDDDDDDDDSDRGGVSIPSLPPPLPPPTAGRRVALSFPGMQLDGIELLVLSRLALVVRCERCKTAVDVGGLQIVDRGGAGAAGEREGTAAQPQPSQAPVQAKTQPSRQSRTCEKCGNYMRVGMSEVSMCRR